MSGRGEMRRVLRWSFAAVLLCAGSVGAAAEEAWEITWNTVLNAARKEGVVVVSGPPGAAQRQAITLGWAKTYPDIKLEYTGARGSAIATRVVRERTAGQYQWDIILASTGPVAFNLIPINALAPLRDALIKPDIADDKTWIGGFDAGFIDKEKTYYFNPMGSADLPLGFVNRDCLSKAVFSKAADMKNPELRGKIVWFDPTGNQGGVVGPTTWVLSLDQGEDWLKDLFQNYGVTFARDYRQMTDWLVTCRKPVAWGMDDDVVEQMQKAGIGKNVERIIGGDFTGKINPGGPGGNESIGWYNNAPHPNAAKIFVNWYLSRDFQNLYASTVKDNSRRADTIPGDPDHVMKEGVEYLNWINEDATVKIRNMQAKIKEWDVVR